jgi:hypothetical protein
MRRRIIRILLGLICIGGISLAFAPGAFADPSSTNGGALNICDNDPSVTFHKLNVIHVPDGDYGPDHYDAQLIPDQCTGFNFNGGFGHTPLGWPHAGGAEIQGGYSMVIGNHAGIVLGTVPASNHSSPAFWFPDNINESYIVTTCRWFGSSCQIE